jgi:hypothetical protein
MHCGDRFLAVTFTVGVGAGPAPGDVVVRGLRSGGRSDVKQYLFEHARQPAWQIERQLLIGA